MGFSWRKSIKILPGVKANLSLKSLGLTFGGKRARVSTNSRRGTRASISLPFGLSYSQPLKGKKKRK